ncbi:hypothetical protein QS306_17160 [Paraburkholderia bonniea]|uniref:hypothetical protein n=1 Tax=Paraburkholderia bonniea TaxID=2152891 RepID=UPI0012923100|nr:hypothetical protein [Paraburkholderia bonniea]WJF91796.1 hypothetical protein QS306_17160 [Paraburkholderia bonniea]WJF95115.1 hypothetical protein QS308_17160 [Paraburkholderia bonniea]
MQNTSPTTVSSTPLGSAESSRSAVSWGAVIAGAVIAAAVSAMLMSGGTGLGFLSLSPWRNEGASGSALAVGTIIWLLLSQIIAYGVAGYVTGRLRTKWTDAAHDEIYFRDTAHGFLVWALSVVVGLVLLGSTVASVVSGTAKAGASLAGAGAGAASAVASQADTRHLSLDYFTDTLLRPNDPAASTSAGDVRQEVSRILTRSIASGQLSSDDENYLVKLVAQRTGVDEAVARQRLLQVEERAKQAAQQAEQTAREAADTARKAAAAFSLWAFASLLIGAFVASYAATIGGRARDR